MRRSIASVCLAASLAAPAPVAAAPAVEPGVVADEEAMASWMFPTDRPRLSKWLFAGAYRTAVAGGRTIATGFAVEGYCKVERERGETVTCHGKGIGGRLPDDAFEVDPALREARLVLRDRGAVHTLAWFADASAPPSGYFAGEACDQGGGQGAGSIRHATARGKLFDRELGSAGIDHAFVARGAMVTECTDDLRAAAHRAAAGKTVRVTFR